MIQLSRRVRLSKYLYTPKVDIMSVILVLLVASLSVALLFLGAFLWSVRNKQYDDDFSPPRRILFDDPPMGRFDDPYTVINDDNIKLTSK